jgi:hypothetical protein
MQSAGAILLEIDAGWQYEGSYFEIVKSEVGREADR